MTGGFAYYRGTANMVCTARLEDGREILFILLGAQRKFMDNGWQVGYYGNYEEMGELINAVFADIQSKPNQFAN